jgi:aminoglycoside phosphotransferase
VRQPEAEFWRLVLTTDFWSEETTRAIAQIDRERRRLEWLAVAALTGLAAVLTVLILAVWVAVLKVGGLPI